MDHICIWFMGPFPAITLLLFLRPFYFSFRWCDVVQVLMKSQPLFLQILSSNCWSCGCWRLWLCCLKFQLGSLSNWGIYNLITCSIFFNDLLIHILEWGWLCLPWSCFHLMFVISNFTIIAAHVNAIPIDNICCFMSLIQKLKLFEHHAVISPTSYYCSQLVKSIQTIGCW